MFDRWLEQEQKKPKRERKEQRKPYYDSRSIDCTCRNHGTCPWCKNNRLFFDRKQRNLADEKLKDWRSVYYE